MISRIIQNVGKAWVWIDTKIKQYSPLEKNVYHVVDNGVHVEITYSYYLMLIYYYISNYFKFNTFNVRPFDYLIVLKDNRRKIYIDSKVFDVMCDIRASQPVNSIKRSITFTKLYVNGVEIDYESKKLVYIHDDNDRILDVFNVYNMFKRDTIENVEIKFLKKLKFWSKKDLEDIRVKDIKN